MKRGCQTGILSLFISVGLIAQKMRRLSYPDKKVGQYAAEIRAKKPPEPYKGKGIRYAGEVVKHKEGKAGKGKK